MKRASHFFYHHSARSKQKMTDQVHASTAKLEQLLASSNAKITEGRIRADQREIKRRNDENEDNAKVAQLVECLNVEENNEEEQIELGWKTCLSVATNAQDLCEMLDKQKSRCDEAVAKLEEIGNQLCLQLSEQDQEYVTALRQNRKEIVHLEECIINEHKALKAAFEKELGLVENAFKTEKTQLLEVQQKELEALMLERDKVEDKDLVLQRDDVEAKRQEIKQAQNDGNSDTIAKKEKMESELRQLEIALENTRARHDLDTDKLEYDVRVLIDLPENESEVKKQKRRIMMGKGELYDSLDIKQREMKAELKENKRLERDCERIERQTNGLREKFERFKLMDEEKYQAVLALHKDDLSKLERELNESQKQIFGEVIAGSSDASTSIVVEADSNTDVNGIDGVEVKRNDVIYTTGDESKVDGADRTEEWNQAETLMTNYRNLLHKREELKAQVDQFKSSNQELEKALKTKLDDEKVNEELTFPPKVLVDL